MLLRFPLVVLCLTAAFCVVDHTLRRKLSWLASRAALLLTANTLALYCAQLYAINPAVSPLVARADAWIRTASPLARFAWGAASSSPYGWLRVALGVVVADLGIYIVHRLQHEVPFLWRFHKVHHTDMHPSAWTTWRHHPIGRALDLVMIGCCRAFLGVPHASIVIYLSIMTVNGMIQHSQLRIPDWLDRRLAWLLVTPNVHLKHHSCKIEETNSNYCFLFTCWDRCFGTYSAGPPRSAFGLEGHRDRRWHSPLGILLTPFRRVEPPLGCTESPAPPAPARRVASAPG